jgi:hypothetical protein
LQPEPSAVTEQDIMAARAACAPRKPKAAVEQELARVIKWANQNDFRNIAGSLRYVLALLGRVDDRS